jgi:hypothetical protein
MEVSFTPGQANFGAGQQPVAEQPAQTSAPATQAPPSPGLPARQSSGPMALGDFVPEFTDITLPRINIAQNIGELMETFEPGTLVLNKQTVLFVPSDIDSKTGVVRRAATGPVTITVLGFKPLRYSEQVPWGQSGLTVNTEAEVRSNGGTLDYKEWDLKKASGMRRFQILADALVAVERPDSIADDDTVFVFPVGGKKYALAFWAMKGMAYTAAAKGVFFTMRKAGCLRDGGYPSFSFTVSTRLKPAGPGKTAWVPVCLPKTKSTPEFLAFASEILGGNVTPAVAAAVAASAAAA